ncbi:Uncharacterised protein [Mycobacteroides abscessus subsp. abscessus]|nr:Uncharacterised protein [Mycobacteroides abscessus subsp. abscessus]
MPPDESADLVSRLTHTVHSGERGSRVGNHRLTGIGKPDLAPRSIEQVLPQFAFQKPDLGAHAGLGDMQCGGRLREARCVGHRQQIAQLVNLHKYRL